MKKYNVFGSPFSHTTNNHTGYSTHAKYPKCLDKMDWVYDNSSQDSFYMDHSFKDGPSDQFSRKKYGLLLESKAIMPHVYEDAYLNLDKYVNVFDLIFTHDESLIERYPEKVKFIPASGTLVKDYGIHAKTKRVSMISSNKRMCRGHELRLAWVEKLKNKVDLYGRGFNSIESKEQALNDYMFSVAIEVETYNYDFTEKVFDCFATGTIPVYIGPQKIRNYFNENGIIFLDDNLNFDSLTSDLYYSKMEAIKQNFELVKEYDTVEDYLYKHYLQYQ